MAICCRQCNYVMTKSESIGYLTPEIYTFIKNIAVPYTITFLNRKTLKACAEECIEGLIVRVLNDTKIPCHRCMKRKIWTTKKVSYAFDQKEEQLQ